MSMNGSSNSGVNSERNSHPRIEPSGLLHVQTVYDDAGRDDGHITSPIFEEIINWRKGNVPDEAQHEYEETPLHRLINTAADDKSALRDLEENLEEWKPLINIRCSDTKETALLLAIWKGFEGVAARLLQAGADPELENDSGWLPLQAACDVGKDTMIEALLSAGANPAKRGHDAQYPLDGAVKWPLKPQLLRELVMPHQHSINEIYKESEWPPLNKAVYHGTEGAIDILLEVGASLSLVDFEEWTPLTTAIRQNQPKIVAKLFRHLAGQPPKDIQSAIDTPDSDGITPIMLLCGGRLLDDTSNDSLTTPDITKELLKLGPDVSAIDFEENTVLHYAMNPKVPRDENLVKALIQLMQPERILQSNIRGETAFDSCFDKENDCPFSESQGLVRFLVELFARDRTRQQADEPLCWTVYRLERHSTALELFTQDEDRDLKDLKDLEDILDYLYPEKAERRINPWDLSEQTEPMKEASQRFQAAIIQNNFFKFRNVQEILYDSDERENVRLTVERLQRFEYNPNTHKQLSSHGPGVNFRVGPNFTWIHLPASNITWMEDAVKKILKKKDCKDETEKFASFLRSSWIEIPDRTSMSRFMRPRYVVKDKGSSTNSKVRFIVKDIGDEETGRSRSQANEEYQYDTGLFSPVNDRNMASLARGSGGEVSKGEVELPRVSFIAPPSESMMIDHQTDEKNDESISASAIYMPYLYFSTYHKGESDRDSWPKIGTKSPEERLVLDEIDLRQSLFAAYKDSVIHQPTTLDEFYYHFASDNDSRRDRDFRNKDQVITKYLKPGGKQELNYWPVLRVSQVWIWIIDEKWIITSTSSARNDVHDNLFTNILEHLQKQVKNGSRRVGPSSATEMSKVIVNYCIGAYERKRKRKVTTDGSTSAQANAQKNGLPKEERSIRQIFSDSINEIGRKESSLFKQAYGHHHLSSNGQASKNKGQSTEQTMGHLSSTLGKVARQLCDIKDIRDDLNILKTVATFQRKVQYQMAGPCANGDFETDYILGDIREMDRFAEQTQEAVKTTLTLVESDIGNLQGMEAVKQGKIVLIFTLVTVWFVSRSTTQNIHETVSH
ncbi:hypothetical protein K456DRAFT_1719835 [Colletotrichum gloeosporioides 23]|nr:hypothetical protein K456DRAFT_1719835 [Colletotrichum gloeosporioides 23]